MLTHIIYITSYYEAACGHVINQLSHELQRETSQRNLHVMHRLVYKLSIIDLYYVLAFFVP